jgi:hypothetical protein
VHESSESFAVPNYIRVTQYLNEKLRSIPVTGHIIVQFAHVDVLADDPEQAVEQAFKLLEKELSVYRVEYTINDGDLVAERSAMKLDENDHQLRLDRLKVSGYLWATSEYNVREQVLDWLGEEVMRLERIEHCIDELCKRPDLL